MNNIYGIILSGGTGSRMKSSTPKQFLPLHSLPLIVHSVKTFQNWGLCKSLTIVTNEEYIDETEDLLGDYLQTRDRIVIGGKTRHESTLNGIDSLGCDENDLIILHDAARPFFTEKELDEVCNSALEFGSSTLAESISETIVRVEENRVSEILDRTSTYSIKTPQVLHTSLLKLLFKEKSIVEPTDLCSWVSTIGVKPKIVLSNPFNLKVTKPEDLVLADAYYPLFLDWKKKDK